jgi:hypothetical protein
MMMMMMMMIRIMMIIIVMLDNNNGETLIEGDLAELYVKFHVTCTDKAV